MATMQKPSTSSVTTAAKRPGKTKTFLAKLHTALSLFDDQISSLGEECATAYETFITTYREAFAEIWPKIQGSDVTVERSHNLDRSFHNSYIIPSFPTREQHARSVQNARSRFNKLNQSYSC